MPDQDEEMTVPWISIGIWFDNILWLNYNHKYWQELGTVPERFLYQWMHICLEIDTSSKTIKASLNGKSLGTRKQINELNTNPKLNMRLGIVHTSVEREKLSQFHGNISNIHIYEKGFNMTKSSKNLCSTDNGNSILLWSDMVWKKINLNYSMVDSSSICPNEDFTLIKVPFKWTKTESEQICPKFGNGQIAGVMNPENPNNATFYMKYYGNDTNCFYFWTPYLYKYNGDESDKVVNMYSNETLDLLWNDGYPDREKKEWFHVAFYPYKPIFENVNGNKKCLLCNSSSDTVYAIRKVIFTPNNMI